MGHRPNPHQSTSALPSSPSMLPPGVSTEDEEDGFGAGGGEENIFRDMTFDEVLEDLHARFLVNLPKEEMTLVRIYWQAEQAHWFYEDYLRPLNPLLPALNQRHFTQLIISSSPLYSSLAADEGVDYDEVWAEYIAYKSMVPCCGGILISETGDKCIMVRGWKASAGWCFPRGKINSGEAEVDCAIREVEEEVGFDLTGWINAKDAIQTQISAQTVTMFIAKGIPESTKFEPQTRKEIGAIEWVRLVDLPTWTGKRPKKTSGVKEKKFYNVTPFVGPLKRWLHEHGINPNQSSKKKNQGIAQHHQPQQQQPPHAHPAQPYRDLQPYAFDSPAASHHHHQQGASAPDNLFNKFIHKQEEDLGRSTPEKVAGGDNKAGLERLFGNMASAPPPAERKEEEGDEDALARLLGAVSLPTHRAAPPPVEGKQSKLLAVLNQPKTPTLAPAAVQETPSRTHQASLLSMLSSPPPPSKPQSRAPHSSPLAAAAAPKPLSLPTSPRPVTPDTSADSDRARRQRALLEMTVAGMGLDTIAPSTTAPAAGGGGRKFPQPPGQPIPVHSSQSAPLQPSPTRNPPPPPPYEAHAPYSSPPTAPNASWGGGGGYAPQGMQGAQQRYEPPFNHGPATRPAAVQPRLPPMPNQGFPPVPQPFAQGGGPGVYRPGPIPAQGLPGMGYRPQFHQPPNHPSQPVGQQGWSQGFPPMPSIPGVPPIPGSHTSNPGVGVGVGGFPPLPAFPPVSFPVPRPPAPTTINPRPPVGVSTVHQPIPRPPAGAGAGLLAMLNDRTGL